MKILLAGAGAVGGLFGALGNQDNQVLFYDINQDKVNSINQDGINIIYEDKKIHYKAMATHTIPNEPQDLIIIAAKTYGNSNLYPLLNSAIGADTKILTVQNGLGNCEALAELYTERRIFAGNIYFGGYQNSDYTIQWNGLGMVKVAPWGESSPEKIQEAKAIVELFNKANIDSEFNQNPLKMLWDKLFINIVANPLTTLYEVINGELLTEKYQEEIENLLKEAIAVANEFNLNFTYDEVLKQVIAGISATGKNTSSMFWDYQCGRKIELNTISGAVLKLGIEKGLDMPYHKKLVEALELKINNRDFFF